MHIFYSLHLHACSREGKDLMRMGLALAVLTLPHTLHLKENWKPLWSWNRHTLNCPSAHTQSGGFSSGTKIQGDCSLLPALDVDKALESKALNRGGWKNVSLWHLSSQPAAVTLLRASQFLPGSLSFLTPEEEVLLKGNNTLSAGSLAGSESVCKTYLLLKYIEYLLWCRCCWSSAISGLLEGDFRIRFLELCKCYHWSLAELT